MDTLKIQTTRTGMNTVINAKGRHKLNMTLASPISSTIYSALHIQDLVQELRKPSNVGGLRTNLKHFKTPDRTATTEENQVINPT